MTTTSEQIEAVARMRLMIQSAVEDDARAWELTDDELAVIAEVAINAMRPFIRAEVLEEAAKVADSYEPRCDICPSGVTAAIRALKEKP
jgi:adenine-specific DNA glycosylase